MRDSLRLLVKAILRRQSRPVAPPDVVLTLQSDLRSLRLELEEREQLVARLREDVERQRSGEKSRFEAAWRRQCERWLSDLATPVAHLLTQAYLLEAEAKPVDARDVLAVAKRLIRLLEDEGLSLVGQVGESIAFDPDRHEPLDDSRINPGDLVVVRFVGATYAGTILRKANVEKWTPQ